MSNLDNQPDPSWTEVQKGNAQAEVMRKLIQSKFPRTYRLLNGIRFQLPARRQADYPNHEYAAYWDGQLLMDGLTASRLKLLGDPTRWKPIAGAFLVTNEWLKLDQRTLFVERELGEALKRTDLPEGFCPKTCVGDGMFCVWFFRRDSSGAKGKYSRAMFRRPLGISHPLPSLR
jgi:hypothetical protein